MVSRPILIVDDNRDLADGLVAFAEAEGHDALVAYDGETALALGRERDFDLIVLDYKLPGISGLEVMRLLGPVKPETRFAVMTGFRIDELLDQLVGSGNSRVLLSMGSDEDLAAAVDEIRGGGLILMADGKADCSREIEVRLASKGIRVEVFRSQAAVFENISDEPPDALLLALEPPLIRSFSVYLELRHRGRSLPTIVLAPGHQDTPDGGGLLRSASLTGLFFKPFEPDDFIHEIRGFLDGQRTFIGPEALG